MSGGAPVLEMRGIRKVFPGVIALDGVDLTLYAGEVHMLLGENGAGKSTLMKVLSGACRKDAGSIVLHGREVAIESPRDALSLGIRLIYQELNLVPHLSVAENVYLGAAPTRWPGVIDWKRLHRDAAALLAGLGVDIAPDTPVRRLGLAQQQMVEIAKALAMRPDGPGARRAGGTAGEGGDGANASILVMDEPTSALTSREVDQLFSLIERLAARGTAIVYITHRLDEVFRLGHRVTVLRDGRRVANAPLTEVAPASLVRLMANREVDEHFPRVRTAPGRELLRAERVCRAGALTDVTFAVRAGEIVGIGGLLGAGRTELARVLAGADRCDSGTVYVDGVPVSLRSPADGIRRGIGLLPEDRKAHGLVAGLTAERNIGLPHAGRLARLGVMRRGAEARLSGPIVSELRVKAGPRQAVRLLSGGNQQKVVLGKWLAGEARLFIFDEPTRGVDIGAKVEIYHLMNRLTARGAGIVMISSELPELLGMSDRILVMHRGRIQAEFDAASATQEGVLAAALGLSGRTNASSVPRGGAA